MKNDKRSFDSPFIEWPDDDRDRGDAPIDVRYLALPLLFLLCALCLVTNVDRPRVLRWLSDYFECHAMRLRDWIDHKPPMPRIG